jgi:hypothetical protein
VWHLSWLTRFRLQAFAFFALGTGLGIYLVTRGFTDGGAFDVVVGLVIVVLCLHILWKAVRLWRRGELPVFDSTEDVHRHVDERMPWLPGAIIRRLRRHR